MSHMLSPGRIPQVNGIETVVTSHVSPVMSTHVTTRPG